MSLSIHSTILAGNNVEIFVYSLTLWLISYVVSCINCRSPPSSPDGTDGSGCDSESVNVVLRYDFASAANIEKNHIS